MELTPRWSAAHLAALAVAAVPGLEVVATRRPRNVTEQLETTGVLDADGGAWLVRAPRDAAAGAELAAEAALLEVVAREDLPFAVATPVGFADVGDPGSATRAVVTRLLPGRALDVARLHPGPGLAASLGSALAALHELPWDAVEAAGLPILDAEGVRSRHLTELDAMAATGRVPSVLLRRWEAQLEDVRLWRFRPVLVHGDLSGERVLVEQERVSAIESFASAHVGDPATDLAWLVAAAPEDALESVLESYALGRTEGGEGAVVARAQLVSELALGRWLLFGLRAGQADVVRDAEAMLADLAEAVAATEPPPALE